MSLWVPEDSALSPNECSLAVGSTVKRSEPLDVRTRAAAANREHLEPVVAGCPVGNDGDGLVLPELRGLLEQAGVRRKGVDLDAFSDKAAYSRVHARERLARIPEEVLAASRRRGKRPGLRLNPHQLKGIGEPLERLAQLVDVLGESRTEKNTGCPECSSQRTARDRGR